MNLGPGIRAELAANAGVAAIVGTRIYPNRIPNTSDFVTPCLWFQAIQRYEPDLMSAAFVKSGLTVFCVADSYDGAHALADAVQSAMDLKRTVLGGVGPDVSILAESREDAEIVISNPEETLDVIICRFSVMVNG